MAAARMTPVAPNPAAVDRFEVARAELVEALGIKEMILLCAVGPAGHEEVFNTLRLFSEQGIPHFRAKQKRAAVNCQAADRPEAV
jgi:hypothetical protein